MDHSKLQSALDGIDANPDISVNCWSRFCEWVESFHDISVEPLLQFETHFDFSRAKEVAPLELVEQTDDLWNKWVKATC